MSPEVVAHQWLAHLSGQCTALKPPGIKMINTPPPEKGIEKDGWIWKERDSYRYQNGVIVGEKAQELKENNEEKSR